MTVCAEDAIAAIEARIAQKVGPKKFGVFFKNATQLSVTGSVLKVSAPNHFLGEWIERHFSGHITDAAREVLGQELALCFSTDPNLARHLGKKQPDEQMKFVAAEPPKATRDSRRTSGPRVLKGRIEDFVMGQSNRMAYAAAIAVIENPASQYNPLFIHGGCGLGKTHLLQGICNGWREKHPHLRWLYVNGEEFTNDYVSAVRAKDMSGFYARYRDLDALVIDDVHFLANKKATQEVFLQTFKAIDTVNKQIVLASDAHPKMIGQFSDSLVSRCVSGMVVRVESPDLEVRVKFLKQRATRLGVSISDTVIRHVAENFQANIRELEGALLKVVAHAQLCGEPITLSGAERAVRDLIRQTAPVVLLSDIESVVSIYFGLTPADLHTSRKSRTIALARGIAMYLARRHTDMSFPEIGRFMGNKNHSTVILAERRISQLLQRDATVQWLTNEGLREQKLSVIMADVGEQFTGRMAAAKQRSPYEAAGRNGRVAPGRLGQNGHAGENGRVFAEGFAPVAGRQGVEGRLASQEGRLSSAISAEDGAAEPALSRVG